MVAGKQLSHTTITIATARDEVAIAIRCGSRAIKRTAHAQTRRKHSASSCCERPVRLRAARSMPPVISTIVMWRLFARRQRASMSAYFTNSLTPPARLGPLAPSRWQVFPGRAARGSVVPRKMACRICRGGSHSAVQGHRFALEGQPSRCPFLIGRKWG